MTRPPASPSTSAQRMRTWIDEYFDEVVIADGWDEAILGVATGCGRPDTVIYDTAKIIDILMARDGMDWATAEEFFFYNIEGAFVEGAPMFLVRPSPTEPAEPTLRDQLAEDAYEQYRQDQIDDSSRPDPPDKTSDEVTRKELPGPA